MEYRFSTTLAGLVAGLALSAAALAADSPQPTPEQRADWDRRLENARSLQEEGSAHRDEAERQFEARKQECLKKFRVYDCQEEARREYVKAVNESRRLINQGKALERLVHKEELADSDARRAAEAPQREAELREREERVRAEREKEQAVAGNKQQKKEQEAGVGAARAAAHAERVRQKREEHERRLAEKREKTAQHEAGAER